MFSIDIPVALSFANPFELVTYLFFSIEQIFKEYFLFCRTAAYVSEMLISIISIVNESEELCCGIEALPGFGASYQPQPLNSKLSSWLEIFNTHTYS